MQYEGTVYRPPSEAHSLLVQITIGCSWNKCTFCDMYKAKQFRVRKMEEIRRDLEEFVPYADRIRRIFLCDGDAFVLQYQKLEEILRLIKELYPHLEAVRVYASARNVLKKTPEELKALRALGLDMVYIGLETGSDKILSEVNKGETKQDMIDAAGLLRAAGIQQSISIISGLAGPENWREHILETADALNQMQPEFLGMLVLMPGSDMDPVTAALCAGGMRLPTGQEVLREMQLLLENLEQENCYFTSAHVSNYVHVKGALPQDKNKMLNLVGHMIETSV